MRCDRVREIVEQESLEAASPPVHEHLVACAACREYARDWDLLRAGFHALGEEPVPEPSSGFVPRLLRQLEAVPEPSLAEEFFERVGRRVVYVTSLVALILLLALALPPSGPLRGPAAAEALGEPVEVVMAGSDPVFAFEFASDVAAGNGAGENRRDEK